MLQPINVFGFTMPLISLILIGFAVVFLVAVQVARGYVTNKLQNLFESKLYDEFLETVDEPLTRFFVPVYNREYLRLNAYMAKGQADKASQSFDQLLTMRSSRGQRDDLLIKAFQFYMQQEKWKDAKGVLDEMKASGRNAKRIATCEQTWEIFGNGSSAYIDEMEAAFEDADFNLKVSYALMLSAQYANRNDEAKAEEWQQKATDLLKTPSKKAGA